ncbi:GlcG/HbpS family heme-binding protein [Bordetella genomosp. 9]|uniref:GlcG protein n=1 Tax=Bordetella genomosp. 9 TaxID=1416803 RepID=A0A1W6Z072_9BORD|nr:heme-binding protein [Bordetella genomosp. 9]ARP86641.1 glcG protein [Bordetella genomosp. 9]ARP90640.1 glcG protein [Bordetella genomosp. 9]
MHVLMRTAATVCLTAGLIVSIPAATAADLPTRPVLTLEAAQKVAAAAQARATQAGWPGVIAVADSDGLPIVLLRMDNTMPASVELAPGKARTAAMFRRPSGALEDAINGPRQAAITARGFVLMRGGVPLVVDGHVVGAIGVSADTPQHDEDIAEAGAAALKN